MGYRPQARTARDFVRRSEKAKQKKSDKQRATSSQVFSEERVLTSREVFDRTFNTLNRLGSQRFPIAPFYEHFDRWLLNLRTVLSEFESNPLISVDEQFAKQYSQVLSDIDQALKERREKEVSREDEIRRINRNLQDARNLLARTEHEHAVKEKEIADRKKRAIKPPAGKAKKPRKEQNRIVPSGTSFLRGLFRKAQPQKETETTQIPDSAKREVSRIKQSFADEQRKLEDEYGRREQSILEKIALHQKEIEDLEAKTSIDDAVNLRRGTCEALVDALNALLSRTKPTSETTNLSS